MKVQLCRTERTATRSAGPAGISPGIESTGWTDNAAAHAVEAGSVAWCNSSGRRSTVRCASGKPGQRMRGVGLLRSALLIAMTMAVLARPTPADVARGTAGMAATVNPLATQAAVDAIEHGGNAVDAALAAGLMLSVVDGHNSGIGGGCFILIRQPDGRYLAIDGRETAPRLAHSRMFLKEGKPQTQWSRTGPLAVAVPGLLAAYDQAARRCGRLPLSDALRKAADRARRGFLIDRAFAARLKATAPAMAPFPATRKIFLKPDGTPYGAGERLVQRDLAETLDQVARHGVAWFYGDGFANQVDAWMREHGGLLRAADFAAYRARLREPIVTSYRKLRIVGFPPPSSGGIHVAQMLNMLESYDLAELDRRDRAQRIHLMAEVMKRAFADRAYWLGDADFARVPRGLIDRSYARRLVQSIDMQRATEVTRHGLPPKWDESFFGGHTTHLTVADAEGYWVAITQTINTSFGSKVVVPGTGVVLNNEMDDFAIAPGVPNAFGLIGAEANQVAPGKRPLSSMSPTIVERDGQPVLTVGAAGGPKIINQVLLVIVRYLDLGMSLEEAVAAARFHHQWRPDRLLVERGLPAELQTALRRRGHRLKTVSSAGVTQAIAVEVDRHGRRRFIGVADPRVPGKAMGWDTRNR